MLGLYLSVYRRIAGSGSYIDGFAGNGRIRVNGETRPGSATVAIESRAFRNLAFYERPRMARSLEKYLDGRLDAKTRSRCTVVPGDFNEQILHDLAAERFPRDKPCFAFLDPNSTQLDWRTIEALAKYKTYDGDGRCKVELWILLNTHQALMRIVQSHPKVVDRMLGGRDAWDDLRRAHAPAGAYATRYAERLEDLGYKLASPALIRARVNGRPMYYMIHASDHPAAHKLMRWTRFEKGSDASEAVRFPGM